MGSMKDLWQNKLDEEKRDWICEQLGIGFYDDVDEESEEWLELEKEYDEFHEHLRNEQEAEEELLWLEKRSWSEELHSFDNEMSKLKQMLGQLAYTGHAENICKMVYAHSVTLMESYLGDALKSLIIKDPQLLKNAVNNVKKIKSSNYKLSQVYNSKNGVLGLVLEELSNHIYHRIPETKEIYSAILEIKLHTKIDKVVQITKIRHDIVHRNAKTISGDNIPLNAGTCYEAISDIETFIRELNREISQVTDLIKDSI